MRVLVCGSRTFSENGPADPIGTLLEGVAANYFGSHTLIHGDAEGADTYARRAAEAIEDFSIQAFPADWETYGKAAGPIRNQRMLDEGKPDAVWAFVDKPLIESRGTSDMVRRAKDAGIPTFVVERV